MRIPEHWSKATTEELDAEGNKASFTCWRSSDKSSEDAHASALDAAKRILRNFLSGAPNARYAYSDRALREQVLQRIANPQGELVAAVTQNSYGSLVLNTAQVMFIDLDFSPIQPGERLRYFFKRWFNKARSPDAQREYDELCRLKTFLNDNPEWGARVYRTCAGLRVMVTHSLFLPAAESTQSLFASLGADPMYVRLCKVQESFRARLTPKPWRCGHASNTVGWPRETEDQRRRFEKWNSAYSQRQSNYATCRFLGELGVDAIHPEVAPILEIHDRMTRCHESLDLA